ncbi:MAG: AhpC/TSA family protein [Rikenellaceae bacterium]|jgi:thiol-disulfide isomerase/thioredoxin|nr:AhpC/TSA family protein [Rikenellaceae bacterium]
MKAIIILLLGVEMFGIGGNVNGATIEGRVAGLKNGSKIYLLDNSAQTKVDSATLAGGKFGFRLANDYPDRAFLSIDGKRYPFIKEQGKIVVVVDLVGDGTFTVSGTETNNRIKALNDGLAGYNGQLKELNSKLSALRSEGNGKTPVFDSLYAVYQSVYEKRSEQTAQTVRESANTIFAAYQLNNNAYSLTTPQMVDSVLTIVGSAPANAFTDKLKERRAILAATAIGQPALDFTQERPDGTPFTFSSLKGKLVLIDFWASWCGPCRAENPNVVKTYNRFREHGFEIVGVSLDNDRDKWLKAIEKDGLAWVHVSDLQYWNNAVSKSYGVNAIPHTVLVDQNGIIIAKDLRGRKLTEKIAEILGVEAGDE